MNTSSATLALGLGRQNPEPLARVLKQILEGYETRKVARFGAGGRGRSDPHKIPS